MSEKEVAVISVILRAFNSLTDEEKSHIIGVAKGILYGTEAEQHV